MHLVALSQEFASATGATKIVLADERFCFNSWDGYSVISHLTTHHVSAAASNIQWIISRRRKCWKPSMAVRSTLR